MAVFQEPTQWGHELGNNADVSTLPDDTSATTGVASLQKLFQVINQTPLEAGGVAPDREDINALFKILGDSVFYAMNGGFASYNAAYDYAVGRYVVYNNTLYKCIQANGASSTVVAPDSVTPLGTDYWKDIENQDSTSLIPNQTIVSELPLTDANLHLKDGALLSGSGTYSAYVDLIADLYNGGTASSSFCTEVEWQASNTAYGFCNKFVYDSVADTVRLPKVNSTHGALIKTYSSGTDWYRIYEDGFCEQGGLASVASDTYNYAVSFIKPFIDNNASVLTTVTTDIDYQSNLSETSINGIVERTGSVNRISSSGFYINLIGPNTRGYGDISWQASGYIDISDLQIAPIYEYIVVGTITKTDIQIDIDNVTADLALKADKDFSNVTAPTQAFKDMVLGWSALDYTSKIDISAYSATTNQYTVPKEGYLCISVSTASYGGVYVNDLKILGSNGAQTDCAPIFIRVSADDSVWIKSPNSNTNYSAGNFYIPCKGA